MSMCIWRYGSGQNMPKLNDLNNSDEKKKNTLQEVIYFPTVHIIFMSPIYINKVFFNKKSSRHLKKFSSPK